MVKPVNGKVGPMTDELAHNYSCDCDACEECHASECEVCGDSRWVVFSRPPGTRFGSALPIVGLVCRIRSSISRRATLVELTSNDILWGSSSGVFSSLHFQKLVTRHDCSLDCNGYCQLIRYEIDDPSSEE